MTSDPTELTIAEASALIAAGGLSPVELTEAYLARIERLQPLLNAYVTVTSARALDDARRAARELRAGERRGPLHGIPIGLKDLYDTAGILTTAGSKVFADRVPPVDAQVASRLAQAGTVLLGKHNTHELAMGGTTENEHFGPTRNPWDTSRVPGGSSGGSAAAVAASMTAGALGTDTCGSIRIPASFCGCVGVKATYGLVSLRGVVPLAPGLDHAGPLARTVADAALLLDAVAGPTAGWSGGRYLAACGGDVARTRVGVVRGYFLDVVDPEVAAGFENALGLLASLGCEVADVSAEVPADVVDLVFALVGAEAAPFHGPIVADHAAEVGPRVLARISLPPPGADEVARVRATLAAAVTSLEQALSGVDVLIVPTEPITAPRIGATGGELAVGGRSIDAEHVLTRLTSIFNVAGFPVVSVPCGFDAAGLPVGLQVVAPRGGEEAALRTAHAYEQATAWHLRRPPLARPG
ncbi:MAG TPA: amidase [Acidimicrobiales bacterium]|nr:amidase [Acidimicrobiales bacterium]